MYENGRRNGTIRFSLGPLEGRHKVEVAGDFSGWKPVPMKRRRDGVYVRNAEVPDGEVEYKFLVDGQWRPDPDHGHWMLNSYGSFNSVARRENGGAGR